MERAMDHLWSIKQKCQVQEDEEERWKNECELVEREDKKANSTMMQMLLQMFSSYRHYTGPYDDSDYHQ